MSNYLLTRAEILDAIERVNAYDTYSPVPRHDVKDGTYRIIGSWIGSHRVWMAQKLSQEPGYEVAYEAVPEASFWYGSDSRYGVWTDPETGEVCLYRTVNVKGNYAVANKLGAIYGQKAIWDWHEGKAIDVDLEFANLP
jgi:hypothetical protein